MNTNKIKINSGRLLLSPITQDYAKDIFTEFTDEITRDMYPSTPSKIQETMNFIENSISMNKDGSNMQMVILDKSTKEFLGCVGIHRINTNTPEFGIWVKKSAHGHGYGKEAVIALNEWAKENLEYDYILYPVVKTNIPSRKIPESLDGEIAREYDKKTMDDNVHYLVEYRIYK